MSLPNTDPPTIAVNGPLTLDEVAHWRDEWLRASGQGGGVRLDLGASGPFDLAGLQLVLSAVRTGPGIRLVGAPGGLRDLARRAGVLDLLDRAAEGPG